MLAVNCATVTLTTVALTPINGAMHGHLRSRHWFPTPGGGGRQDR